MEKLQVCKRYCKSKPVLKVLDVNKIETSVGISSLDLMCAIFCNTSRARSFYCHLLNMYIRGKLIGHSDLIAKVKTICLKHEVNIFLFLIDKVMPTKERYILEDGLADSVRQLPMSHDPYDRHVLSMLLVLF